jgi:purine-nucleoside phosphorylase
VTGEQPYPVTRVLSSPAGPGTVAPSEAARAVAEASGVPAHHVAVVLGSGWAAVADALGRPVWEAPLTALPGFPAPTAVGHGGTMRSVVRGRIRVLVLLGRVHLYEGLPASTVVHGVRTAVAAGCRVVVLSNAAGGLRPEIPIGTPVLIRDHLDLTARGPGLGAGPAQPRATGSPPGGSEAGIYSPRLRMLAREVDPTLLEGVYAGLVGPHFETPAEIRALRVLGADLVGMSTVLEATAVRAAGSEVLGISLVSNLAAGISAVPLSAEDVIAAGQAAQPRLAALLAGVLDRLGTADQAGGGQRSITAT